MFKLTGKSLIGRREADESASATRFNAVNPATGEALSPVYHVASDGQIASAAQLALQSFENYAAIPGAQRGAFLRAIATNLAVLAEQLVERIGQETALPEQRIRNELVRTANQLRLFAELVEEGSWVDARIDPAQAERKPQPRPDIRSMLRPLGPVAVFGSSNFPLAFSVAGGDTASALAAGCPVIVKAHSAHPGTSELVGRAVLSAAGATGMPDGVFSLLFGGGSEVGVHLVRQPAIQAVGFTGSLRAGRHLFNVAAARDQPIPVYAEMGSVNPVFLLPGALAARADEIAAGLHQSATLGVGQFCTNPGLVLYDGNEQFCRQLVARFEETAIGCMLSAEIAQNYRNGLKKLCEQPAIRVLSCRAHGGRAEWVGAALVELGAAALVADPTLADEVFGPSSLLVRYEDTEQLLAVARTLPGQLTASIHAGERDQDIVRQLLPVLETKCGRLVFDQFPTGVEVGQAMVHGGPYPATTDSRSTSVGTAAILRFARRVCFQNCPSDVLPAALQDVNPLGLRRLVDGKPERDAIFRLNN